MTPLFIGDTIISESVELVFSFSSKKMAALEERIAKALQEGKEKFVERVNGLKDTRELKDVL